MNTQLCTDCGLEKELSEFNKRKISITGYTKRCRVCRNKRRLRYKLYNEVGELYCPNCKTYKLVEQFDNNPANIHRDGKDRRCKECKRRAYDKRRKGLRGTKDINRLLLERWHGLKDRGKKKGWKPDFMVDYLKELWDKQEGKCAISDIQMTAIFANGRIPTNVSIDRIRPRRPYEKGNIQLVCIAVNQMKSDMTTEQLIQFCQAIVDHAMGGRMTKPFC